MVETNFEYFSNLLSERILILDGAMGTMIQKYGLSEDDFRGELFKNWPVKIKGNNDVIDRKSVV